MRGDLLLRCAAPDEDGSGALVVELALSRCEVVVDGGLHQRMHEAERRLGSQDLGAHELPCRGSERR